MPRTSARARPSPNAPVSAQPVPMLAQLDLFPESPQIERLNPKQIVGQRTAVVEIVRVRVRRTEAPHLVFHDRHGWYCETHGPHCVAVLLARESIENNG